MLLQRIPVQLEKVNVVKRFCIGQAGSRNGFINYFSPLLEPGRQMQLTTLGFRSPFLGSDVLSIAAVAGCALEMKYFATTFLNSARHCISANTEFHLQRVWKCGKTKHQMNSKYTFKMSKNEKNSHTSQLWHYFETSRKLHSALKLPHRRKLSLDF